MKNYLSRAENNGLLISDKMYDDTIRNYYLNKENGFIRIEYFDGAVETVPLSEKSLEEVQKEQEEDFYNIKRKIAIQTSVLNSLKASLIGGNAFLSITNFVMGNISQGTAFALLGISFSLKHMGYKAYREMKLVSWLLKNRNQVNSMIREDVETFISNNNNMNYQYPSEEVIYPKAMYEEGINLKNIEDLSVKELKLIKRKTKQREKQLQNK